MDIFEFSDHHPNVDSDKVAETDVVVSSAKADSMDIFEFSEHHPNVDSDKVAESDVVASPKMGNTSNESGVEVINVDLFPTQEEERYLCFPFLAGEKVELAAKGLHLCDPLSNYANHQLITMQLQKTVGRNHIVTLTKDDRLTLKPSRYVNDNVIDFWMVWLTRNVSDADSSIIIFTSHFYSTLTNDTLGVEHVSGWMNYKSIDIFSKNMLLFPICLDNHWSLIACIYPGRVNNYVPTLDNTPGGMIIHLDSMNYHNGFQISQNLRCFFNFQWSKKKGCSIGSIFTTTTYPLFSPAGMLPV